MIIDFHTHIFPADICRNRECYFPSEPAFELLYKSSKSKLVRAEELLASMDANRVDKSVVFGFPWKNPDTAKMHNDYIMDAVVRYPERFIGLGCFEPSRRHSEAETERCLKGGMSGIGELAFYEEGIDGDALKRLDPIMEICREWKVPVLIHTNEPVGHAYPGKTPNTLAQIYSMVKRFPKNTIVLAHWGGGIFFFSLLKKEIKAGLENIYFDTAASPYLYDPAVYRLAIDLVGPDKILFGSDYPLLAPPRYFQEFENADLSRHEIQKISGMNAKALLKL